jgi:hypothetical protein
VKVIKEDSKGNILIGGGGGLIILNLITKQFTHYVNDPAIKIHLATTILHPYRKTAKTTCGLVHFGA